MRNMTSKPKQTKNFLIDGVVTPLESIAMGAEWTWAKDNLGDTHVIPSGFFEGRVGAYITSRGRRYDQYGPKVSPHEDLIQRIEYVLHSGYDANDRELLREALVAIKEQA